ncbi:MAG: hypothetical protein AAGM22_33160 [Acidobacteriota bacterium]
MDSERGWRHWFPPRWVLLLCAAVSATAGGLAMHGSSETTPFQSAASVFQFALAAVWTTLCLLVMAHTFSWFLRRLSKMASGTAEETHSKDVLPVLTAMALRLWGLALPLAWVLLLNVLRGLELLLNQIRPLSPGGQFSPSQLVQDADRFMRLVVPTMTINWLLLVAVVCVAFCEWRKFIRNTKGNQDSEARILLSPSVLLVFHATTLLYCIENLLIAVALYFAKAKSGCCALASVETWTITGFLAEGLDRIAQRLEWPYFTVCDLEGVGWAIAALVAIAAFLFRKIIRIAVDFAMDVTNYFGPDGGESAVRRQILTRFKNIYSEIETRFPEARLIFVTHSQGTVLTGDFLRTGTVKRPIDWVTMGSPISHIYAHYFSNAYKPTAPPERDVNWINLYRNSDFVGRKVKGCQNEMSIGEGGHTGYFTDAQLLEVLEGEGLLPEKDKNRPSEQTTRSATEETDAQQD